MRWSLGIAVVSVLVVGVAAYAVGASRSSTDLTLCAAKKSGDLSLGSKGKCGKGEKKLVIAKQGPRERPGRRDRRASRPAWPRSRSTS